METQRAAAGAHAANKKYYAERRRRDRARFEPKVRGRVLFGELFICTWQLMRMARDCVPHEMLIRDRNICVTVVRRLCIGIYAYITRAWWYMIAVVSWLARYAGTF